MNKGIDAVISAAAKDSSFAARLIFNEGSRAEEAVAKGFELSKAEKAMLDSASRDVLRALVNQVKDAQKRPERPERPPHEYKITGTRGIQPDRPRRGP